MDAALSTLFEGEVLYGVREVNVSALEPCGLEGAIEDCACRTDEGTPTHILDVAGLFADQDDCRAFGPLAEDHLRRARVKVAAAARGGRVVQPAEVPRVGDKRCGRFRRLWQSPPASLKPFLSPLILSIVFTTLVLLSTLALTLSPPPADDVALQLERKTRELLDAIAAGNREPWVRYLHDDLIYAAEDGSIKSKAQLLEELQPLPKQIWGKLRVAQFRMVRSGATAVCSYVTEEDEGYYGQVIHARYHSTDTWIETAGEWHLLASQVLALRDDPPQIALPASALDQYVGTYSLTPEVTYTIRRDGDGLVGQRTGRKPETLRPEVADYFFVPGQPRLRKVFQRDAAGRITGFVERRETWDIVWRRKD